MHGGAITLAKKFMDMNFYADLILATDMLDLTTFLSLTKSRQLRYLALYIFMKINFPIHGQIQIESSRKKRPSLGFINLSSALTPDHVLFNSQYHHDFFYHKGVYDY
ncbi:MAG: hypothetical protein Ct9H300mP18_07020 [Candidatus Neomarinimicrobiota bacterium]|nr:MAG: hypothetical protein Ct9H300mP18_07020 [Candidatus Neomarinimicrobiota bacterium]